MATRARAAAVIAPGFASIAEAARGVAVRGATTYRKLDRSVPGVSACRYGLYSAARADDAAASVRGVVADSRPAALGFVAAHDRQLEPAGGTNSRGSSHGLTSRSSF